jgi:hypothetical protein
MNAKKLLPLKIFVPLINASEVVLRRRRTVIGSVGGCESVG